MSTPIKRHIVALGGGGFHTGEVALHHGTAVETPLSPEPLA